MNVSELKSHTGGCHCGRVRYSVQTSLSPLISCNCSICAKTGAIFTFVPEAAFELARGGDALTDYQFNQKTIHHLFCETCGVRSFARGTGHDGAAMVAINVRCLDDVDVSRLSPTAFDGRSL